LKVLFVCLGNTGRSPMAKAIFEQILKQRGLENEMSADSAANSDPSLPYAEPEAREAIKRYFRMDLLADHIPKSIDSLDLRDFDLVLTMEKDLKRNFPPEKTYTLKEYAGLKGKFPDLWHKPLDVYLRYIDEMKDCLEIIIERILKERGHFNHSI